MLKLKYKASGGPSFTLAVVCRRRQFALREQQVDPNAVRISTDDSRRVEKNWRYLPLAKSFPVCHQKIYLSLLHSTGIQLIPVEFWLRLSMNAENVGSLPASISEDAQQSSSTYKISTTFSVHTRACVFLLQLRIP